MKYKKTPNQIVQELRRKRRSLIKVTKKNNSNSSQDNVRKNLILQSKSRIEKKNLPKKKLGQFTRLKVNNLSINTTNKSLFVNHFL